MTGLKPFADDHRLYYRHIGVTSFISRPTVVFDHDSHPLPVFNLTHLERPDFQAPKPIPTSLRDA
ncbi:UNVERIFIED_ORG: hypothetical protein ABIB19_003813 [Arthrobacter sp. UYEF10]